MKILWITAKRDDGVFAVRGELPAKYFKTLGHQVSIVSQDGKMSREDVLLLVNYADIIVLSRFYGEYGEFVHPAIVHAKRLGKKIIYDTDDLLVNLSPDHPSFNEMKPFVPQIIQLTRMADVVTITGSPLEKEYGKYNFNTVILPNCIDPSEWKLRRGKNKKLHIGWTGTLTHISDLLIIIPVIEELQKEYDFKFTLFGLTSQRFDEFKDTLAKDYLKQASMSPNTPKREWYRKFELLVEALDKIKWKHVPFVPISEYKTMLKLMNFDIGLCPLEDNRFNNAKSCIKFYEYAMVGTVTLSSKVMPYSEEVMYCAKNRHDKWKSKLKALIESEDLRKVTLFAQRNFVLNERNIAINIKDWEKAYEH